MLSSTSLSLSLFLSLSAVCCHRLRDALYIIVFEQRRLLQVQRGRPVCTTSRNEEILNNSGSDRSEWRHDSIQPVDGSSWATMRNPIRLEVPVEKFQLSVQIPLRRESVFNQKKKPSFSGSSSLKKLCFRQNDDLTRTAASSSLNPPDRRFNRRAWKVRLIFSSSVKPSVKPTSRRPLRVAFFHRAYYELLIVICDSYL